MQVKHTKYLSFSWYWRPPAIDSVGTAVRSGDARLGRAAAASALLAVIGTAVATLRNMMENGRGVGQEYTNIVIGVIWWYA